MTSLELADLIVGYHFFQDKSIKIDEDFVFAAAKQAQVKICSELDLLEGVGTFILGSGQETYSYPRIAITDATNADPIVLTVPSHGRLTGDIGIITGVLGNTAADGTKTLTVIDSDHVSLSGAAGNGAYTSGGYLYSPLSAAVMLREQMSLKTSQGAYSIVKKKTVENIDILRSQFQAANGGGKVAWFYEIFTNPLTVGFLAIPADTFTASVVFRRKPLDHEAPDVAVDPLIPSEFDMLLYHATLYHIFELLIRDAPAFISSRRAIVVSQKQTIQVDYEREKARARSLIAERSFSAEADYHHLRW